MSSTVENGRIGVTFHSPASNSEYADYSTAANGLGTGFEMASTTTPSHNNIASSFEGRSSELSESHFTATKPTRVGAHLVSNEISQGDPNYFHLRVPSGTTPGHNFEFTTRSNSRRFTARCPPQAGPGSALHIAVLPERQTMYMSLRSGSLTLSSTTATKKQGGANPMRDDVKRYNEQLLQSISAVAENLTKEKDLDSLDALPSSVIVMVPDGIEEEMPFVLMSHNKRFLVKCPKGAKPGTKIRVPLPQTSEAESGMMGAFRSFFASGKTPANGGVASEMHQEQFKLFDIIVPPGAQPNQLLPVDVYGKRVTVRLPASVLEGQTITLKVPLQDVVGDLQLDYEHVDTSLTGGWNRTIRTQDLKFQWVNSNLSSQGGDIPRPGNMSTRSISTTVLKAQDAIRNLAFVRNLIILEGNDTRLPTGKCDLILAAEAVTESEFRLHPFSKPLVTYANTAHHIQSQSSLEIKQEWLYQHVLNPLKQYSSQDGSKIRLLVRRSTLLADSVHSVLSLSPKDMKRPWQIEFVGEPGLDYGGIMREWIQLVTEQLFNPDLGLWLSSVNNQVLMRINSAYHVSCPDDYLRYFRFLGRIMGKALLDRQVIQGHMARHLYKHLLGWPITFADLEEQDEEFYANLKRFTLMNAEELSQLYLDFSVTEDVLGQRKTVDLVPNGSQIELNADNLTEFLEAILRYRMFDRDKLPIQELLLGFADVIPEASLTVFDPNELELMLCGLPIIDVDDWQANTLLTGNVKNQPNAKVIEWFWHIVREDFDQEMTARLLQFSTGTSGVPSLGFSSLLGNDGNIKLFTINGVSSKQYPYPRSHTCFNRIDLPNYSTKQELYEKLKAAITTSAVGFGIE